MHIQRELNYLTFFSSVFIYSIYFYKTIVKRSKMLPLEVHVRNNEILASVFLEAEVGTACSQNQISGNMMGTWNGVIFCFSMNLYLHTQRELSYMIHLEKFTLCFEKQLSTILQSSNTQVNVDNGYLVQKYETTLIAWGTCSDSNSLSHPNISLIFMWCNLFLNNEGLITEWLPL